MHSHLFIEILKRAGIAVALICNRCFAESRYCSAFQLMKDFSLMLDQLPHYVILKVLSHAQIINPHKSCAKTEAYIRYSYITLRILR